VALDICGEHLEYMAIVDDQPDARKAYTYAVRTARLEPHEVTGPLPEPSAFVASLDGGAMSKAVLCDHSLRVREYATYDGAELVAYCFERGIPALLCTRWEPQTLDAIRAHRAKIPVLLASDELGPDELARGLERCVRELKEGPDVERKLWRNQVLVTEVDEQLERLTLEIPGWHLDNGIRLPMQDLPRSLRMRLQPGFRFHTRVNLGALSPDELYFEWPADD
jgi:hypothetical protein